MRYEREKTSRNEIEIAAIETSLDRRFMFDCSLACSSNISETKTVVEVAHAPSSAVDEKENLSSSSRAAIAVCAADKADEIGVVVSSGLLRFTKKTWRGARFKRVVRARS